MKYQKWFRGICLESKHTISTSIFFAAVLSLLFNPFAFSEYIGFLSFDRIMGSATLFGVDASLRIRLFQMFNFVFVPICFCISVLFCHLFTSKAVNNTEDDNMGDAFSFLNSVSVCALALTVVYILNKYSIHIGLGMTEAINTFLQQYSILTLPIVIAIAVLIYIRNPFCKFAIYRFGLFVSLGLTFFINFMFRSNTGTSMVHSLLRFYGIFILAMICVLCAIRHSKLSDFNRLCFASVPLSYGLLFAGFSLEAFNILNQHGVFIINRLGGAKIVFAIMFFAAAFVFSLAGNKRFTKLKDYPHWETISIVGLLMSLYYFMEIPPLYAVAGTELFEQANHGLLVNDFLAWGRFPMINSFDAHTLAHSFGMIIYGLLNGDLLGASYYGYTFVWTFPLIISLFLVYKNVFDKYFAFFFLLIAPDFPSTRVSMGIISIIALLYAMKKRSFFSYIWFLFSVVIGLIYNIPSGFAYGGAGMIIIIIDSGIDVLKNRKITNGVKAFLKASGVFIIIIAVSYIGICIQQQINPIKRALEFLGIAMSTNNWTPVSLGDASSMQFGLLYSVLPLIVVGCLVWLITHYKYNPVFYTTCAFFLVYMLNTTRSLQRHSLAENQIDHVISSSILGMSFLFALTAPPKKGAALFVAGVFIFTGIFNGQTIQGSNSMARAAIISMNAQDHYYTGATEKVTRVDLTQPFSVHKDVIEMINGVIPPSETYLDMTGNTMLYALSGREKPVYANQSVSEISGDYAQTRVIEEIEEDYLGICDFVLVNTDLWTMNIDGVNGFYRYYYVFEYLYNNYSPLCKSSDNYALWIRKDRYDELSVGARIQLVADIPIGDPLINPFDIELVSTYPLLMKTGIIDPQFYLPLHTDVEVYPTALSTYRIELTYKSSIDGEAQMFFDFEGINETDSKRVNLSATNDFSTALFTIPVREGTMLLNGIRLDPPSNALFEVASIEIIEIEGADSILPIDYGYLGNLHTTNIGQIPYVWGQFDEKESWNNPVVASSNNPIDEVSNDTQQQAKYALLTIDSPNRGNGALTFQDASGEDISIFSFSLLEGNNRYIIRCSTDWWWNQDMITSYRVGVDNDAIFHSISFLIGD